MSKLKIKLKKVNATELQMRVVSQPEHLWLFCESSGSHLFHQGKRFIFSSACPQLLPTHVFIRGSEKNADHMNVSYIFGTSSERDEMIKFIRCGIKSINQRFGAS